MAPKRKNPASGSESTRPTRAGPFDRQRFLSEFHEERFKELESRKVWQEKIFNIDPAGKYHALAENFDRRKWGKLINPHPNINIDILREFYANALPIEDAERNFTYTTYVRGKTIRFDREAINQYLGDIYPLSDPSDLCPFHLRQASGKWDHDKIQEEILQPGRRYDVSAAGREHRAFYKDMTYPAQVILQLILHNIKPKSHTSSTTTDVTPLVWFILSGRKVDVARIIAKQLKLVTLSGRFGEKCRLPFPGLIMRLVLEHRVHIPPQVHEEIKFPINDAFIARLEKKNNSSRPSNDQPGTSHAPPPPPATTTPQPFDFSSFSPWMYQMNQYTWDQNEALHRSNTALHQSVYNAHMHPGDPAYPLMTPEAFQTYVAWPEVRPNPYGGGGPSHEAEGDDGAEVDVDPDDENVVSANSSEKTQSEGEEGDEDEFMDDEFDD